MSTTVILGAGIIGLSTAYYLSEHQPPSTIHLVEPSKELFASASGYAGGFLARDWFGPSVAALGALSFAQHRQLAETHGGAGKWGYSKSTSLSYKSSTSRRSTRKGDDWLRRGGSRADAVASVDDSSGPAPAWLRRHQGDEVELISEDGGTAQVDPLMLCRFLLQECLDRGVHLHHPAAALSTMVDVRNELSSVRIAELDSSTETDIPCTRVIITAGAWSGQVFETLFPHSELKLPVSSIAGHSLVLKSPRWSKEVEERGCHAIFTTSRPGFSPEIFSRMDGTIYLAGLNSPEMPLPKLPLDRQIVPESIVELREFAKKLLGADADEDDLEVEREGLCFRPVTESGTPIITRIDDSHLGVGVSTRPGADGGVYCAAGHGPWGISLSLGTGMVLAEMVQGRRLSADVESLALFDI